MLLNDFVTIVLRLIYVKEAVVKALFFILFIVSSVTAFAKINTQRELAIIESIDSFDFDQNYIEVSEDALPKDLYRQLIEQIEVFRFALLEQKEVNEIFEELEKNPRARMKKPKGYCAQRRAYIQDLLKQKNIVTGQLLIKCPSRDGRLRLTDQVSGYKYTYSNYHDANIVAIKTIKGNKFLVLDLQFEARPVSLEEYLTEVELSQKIRPLKTRGTESSRGTCYWSISTDYLTF